MTLQYRFTNLPLSGHLREKKKNPAVQFSDFKKKEETNRPSKMNSETTAPATVSEEDFPFLGRLSGLYTNSNMLGLLPLRRKPLLLSETTVRTRFLTHTK